MGTHSLSLKWNSHQKNLIDVFEQLLWNEDLVDVTLACEGITLKAHKTLLSACSPFFHSLFLEHPCKHPVIIMKDIKYTDLKSIVEFMYRGEIVVPQDRLTDFLKTAEALKVKGLTENSNNHSEESAENNVPSQPQVSSQPSYNDEMPLDCNFVSHKRRKRLRAGRRGSSNELSDDESQTNSKDEHYHANTDSSKMLVECNDGSQEKITIPHNLNESTVSFTSQQLSTTFDSSLIDSGRDIEIPNDLCSHLKKESVQIIPSSELVSPEIGHSNSKSNSTPVNLPSVASCTLDTAAAVSRTVSQEARKGIKSASSGTYAELPVTYESGVSLADDNAISHIKIEPPPSRFSECEQAAKEGPSTEPLQSSTCMASYLLQPAEEESNNTLDLQNYIVPSSREEEFGGNQAITILNRKSQTQETPETSDFRREYRKFKQTKLVCKFCNKHFPFHSYLIRHLTTHSQQRPFSCEQCGKRFKRLSHAKSHSQTHLRNSFS